MRFILHDLARFAADDSVGRFEQRFDADREDAIEIDAAKGIVGADSTSFWRMTAPSSSPSVGRKMVRPVLLRPWMIAQLIEDGPRCSGSSDGWNWIMPCFGVVTKDCGANCVT